MGHIKKILKEELKKYNKLTNMLFEGVKYDPNHPERMNPDLEKKLKDKTHPYKDHPAFPGGDDEGHFGEKIASSRFNELVKKIKRYHGTDKIDHKTLMKFMGLITEIRNIEQAHKTELEELAKKIVREYFDIPENEVDMEFTLIGDLVQTKGMKDSPTEKTPEDFGFEDYGEIEQANSEVQKRRFINALIQGSAKKGTYMFHLVENELDNIDPRLVNLYGKVMSIGDFMYWLHDDLSMGDMKGGTAEVDLNDEEENGSPKIIAKGDIFPLLVHEGVKGAMELLSTHGLPRNDKMRKYVIDKSDFAKAESWDMRFGPGLWDKFVDAIDEDDYKIKQHLYHEVVQMPATEFHEFMREILAGTNKGKQQLADLATTIKKEIKQEEYEEAMGQYDDNDEDDINDIDISGFFK